MARLELESREGYERWGFFTPRGTPLRDTASLLRCPRLLAFEGALFIWPGVRLGHRRTVGSDPAFGDITLVTQSLQPLVFLVDPLLTDAECAHIIAATTPSLEVSDVSHFDADLGQPSERWRRSLQARLANDRDENVTQINDRVASLLRIPRS